MLDEELFSVRAAEAVVAVVGVGARAAGTAVSPITIAAATTMAAIRLVTALAPWDMTHWRTLPHNGEL